MLNSIRAELYKLGKLKGFKIILLVNAAIYAMLAVLILITADMIPSDLPEGVIISVSNVTISGYDVFKTALIQLQSNIVFIATFIGLFVCGDFANRTLGLAVSSGKSRMSMLVGKIVAVMLGTVLILIIVPIVMTTLITAINGFGVEFTAEIFREMVIDFILYLIVNLSVTSMCIFVAYLLKNMGVTMGICIGALLIYGIIAVMPLGETWQKIMEFTPLYYANNMGSIETSGDIIKVIGVSIVTFLLAGGFSYIALQRAELK